MNKKPRVATAAWICAICIAVLAGAARAAEIKVLGSAAARDVVATLSVDYERSTGNKVVATWTGTVDVLKRLQGGEVVDLVILSGPDIDKLIQQGTLVPGSQRAAPQVRHRRLCAQRRAAAGHQHAGGGQARAARGQVDLVFDGPERRLSPRPVRAHGRRRRDEGQGEGRAAGCGGGRPRRTRRGGSRTAPDQRIVAGGGHRLSSGRCRRQSRARRSSPAASTRERANGKPPALSSNSSRHRRRCRSSGRKGWSLPDPDARTCVERRSSRRRRIGGRSS